MEVRQCCSFVFLSNAAFAKRSSSPLYQFLIDIVFLYPFQAAGFRPNAFDCQPMQLILIVHKIHEALERGKDARMVFLDISKAFDKVWHEGLIYKLEALGVRDPLLRWIKSYLTNRKQRVMISGQCSDWKNVGAGVPQGSVLGPLLFFGVYKRYYRPVL